MARKLLSMMGLPDSEASLFASRSLVYGSDVLCKTELDLMELLDVPMSELTSAVKRVQECVCPPHRSVLSLWEERKEKENGGSYLATQFKELDEALGGGVPFGLITELVGAPGIGKTQFCLMLSVMAAMPTADGLSRSVIYIDTEHKFSSGRMMEIARTRFPELAGNTDMMQQLAQHVLVLHPSSLSELMKSLQDLEVMVIEHSASLVIIDSVAALLSPETELDNFFKRQEALGKQASLLKFIAESVRIPVVVTNQVRMTIAEGLEDGPNVSQPDLSFLGDEDRAQEDIWPDITYSTDDEEPPEEWADAPHLMKDGELLEEAWASSDGEESPEGIITDVSDSSDDEGPRQRVPVDDPFYSSEHDEPSQILAVADAPDLTIHEDPPDEVMAGTSYMKELEGPPDVVMGDDLIAALGTKWAHSVNIRLVLEFSVSGDRQIKIVKSPMSPFAIVPYCVTAKGLEPQVALDPPTSSSV